MPSRLRAAPKARGADAVLSVVPYYNKPTQAGLPRISAPSRHATGLPIILYEFRRAPGAGSPTTTVARLAERSQFIGLKDATGDIARPQRLTALVGPQFRLLSGDDATAPAFLAPGGHGCISVASNVVPSLCRILFLACRRDRCARNGWRVRSAN